MADTSAQALEHALVAHPDDLAVHAAYADHLIEKGDPRGEFIRVQVGLEDGKLAAAERMKLAAREKELLDKHRADWLGGLAERDDLDVRFARGWITSIQARSLREELASLLAHAPELRLLRELAVIDPYATPLDRAFAWSEVMLTGMAMFSDEESNALAPLTEATVLGNLRVFRLGDPDHERCDVAPHPLLKVLSRMPGLEELDVYLWDLDTAAFFAIDTLPRLRTLRVGGTFMYDVDVLAANDRLPELRELFLDPSSGHGSMDMVWTASETFPFPKQPLLERLSLHFMRGLAYDCEALVSSGLLKRLRSLELQYSALTDDAGEVLAGCPDLQRLERLDVSFNHLSDTVLDKLRKACPNVVSAAQIPEASEGSDGFEVLEDDWEEDA
ncbi:MAG: TIGR02996 domain-containing protein [Gemmataceae bacterium]